MIGFNKTPYGRAPRWADLNGRWAVPSETYAQNIFGLGRELRLL